MAEHDTIISTRDRPGEYDALETAKPDEIIFVLQGGDPFAPPTVTHWAELARAAGMAEEDPVKAAKLLKKAGAAETVAWAMKDYQRGEIAAGRAVSADRDAGLDGSDRQATLARGADRTYNAIAEMNDLAAALVELGEGTAASPLRDAVAALRVGVELFEPRRHLRGDAG
jgi:hypothetical protein